MDSEQVVILIENQAVLFQSLALHRVEADWPIAGKYGKNAECPDTDPFFQLPGEVRGISDA